MLSLRSARGTLAPVILVLAISVTTAIAQQEQPPSDPIGSITEAELRDHIFYMASDSLEGRDTGTTGYMLAAQYSAIHFHQAGLLPMFTDSSGSPTFYQQIQFGTSTIEPESVIRVTVGGVERTLHLGPDFIAQKVFTSGSNQLIEGNPVFLGFGIEEPELGWNDYEGVDVAGRIVLMMAGAPTEDGEPVLPEEQHNMYSSLQRSSSVLIPPVLNHQASILMLVLDPDMLELWDMIASQMNQSSVGLISGGGTGTSLSWIVLLKPEAAVELFSDTGLDPHSGRGSYTPGELENVHVSLDMKQATTLAYSSPNIVGLLPGSDPVLKDEYVVVTAHLDHLGVRNGAVYNGADDNASGSAAVLEAAEAAAMMDVKRSIIFVLLTAEEMGLLGSRHFADNPPVPVENMVLNINLDMVGRNSPDWPESLLALASENGRSQLVSFINDVNSTIVGANLDMRLNEGDDPHAHVQRSDQMSFMQHGIPAILITRGFMGPDYHESSDDPETVNYPKVLQAARLTFALAVEAANREALFDWQ